MSGLRQGPCRHPRASPELTNRCLPILSHQLLLWWCLVCPPWSPVMVRAQPQRLPGRGESPQASDKSPPSGSPGQKGTIMGILRSLGALGRAVGPVVAASGKCCRLALPICRVLLQPPPVARSAQAWRLRGVRCGGQERGCESLGGHFFLHSVLADWSPGLLHRVLRPLSAPLLTPEEAEASGRALQGGVAKLPHPNPAVKWAAKGTLGRPLTPLLGHPFLRPREAGHAPPPLLSGWQPSRKPGQLHPFLTPKPCRLLISLFNFSFF